MRTGRLKRHCEPLSFPQKLKQEKPSFYCLFCRNTSGAHSARRQDLGHPWLFMCNLELGSKSCAVERRETCSQQIFNSISRCIYLIHFSKCTNDRKRCYHHLKGKILTDFFKHGTILLHSLKVISIALLGKNVFLLFIFLLQSQHSYGRVHWILFWLVHQQNWQLSSSCGVLIVGDP